MLFLIEGFNHVCSELINTNSAECSLEQARMCRCAHVWVLLYTFDVREQNWWGEKNRWLCVVYAALTREKYCLWGAFVCLIACCCCCCCWKKAAGGVVWEKEWKGKREKERWREKKRDKGKKRYYQNRLPCQPCSTTHSFTEPKLQSLFLRTCVRAHAPMHVSMLVYTSKAE